MYYDIVKFDPVNNYFVFTSEELEQLKTNMTKDTLKQFEADMSMLFNKPLETVTSKQRLAPSGNPHDYVSLATYWWPNPDTDNGLPYIKDDGNANPDGVNYDKDKLRRLAYLVYHAGVLYYLTDDCKYYDLLKRHINHWFFNAETKMNPHMNYGQFIPGVVDGRAEGIIDYAANFSYALQLLTVLNEKGLIEADLINGLKEWHRDFRTWLLESEIGIKESNAKNNHGTFYDFVILVLNQFLGEKDHSIELAKSFVEKRINFQVEKDGSLPHETARTKSKNYSFMGLKGMMDFAKLMEAYEVNLWDTKIKDAVHWLFNLAIVKGEWPYKQITQFDEGIYIPFMHQVSIVYGDSFNRIDQVASDKIVNKVPYYIFVG
jgi:Alginate lyase